MLIYFCGFLVCFVFDKIKQRIISMTFNASVKAIKYHPSWHKEHDVYIDWFSWVIVG